MENFVKLGLQEICGIMGTLGRTTEVESLRKEYEVDGITYTCNKEGNTLVIASSDGRVMSIGINAYTEVDDKDPNRIIKYCHHKANIDYYLSNGEKISLSNDLGLYEGYDQYENVERHHLMDGLEKKYIDKNGKEIATFDLEGKSVTLANHKKYEFLDNGIKFGDYLLSLDGKELLLIRDKKASTREEAERFDLEEERKMIDSVIEGYDLHEYSKEALRSASINLELKDSYAKEITRFYNEELKDVRKAINIRTKVLRAFDEDAITHEALYPISFQFHKDALGTAKQL